MDRRWSLAVLFASMMVLQPAMGEEFNWSFDQLENGGFSAENGVRLEALRGVEEVEGIEGKGVRLSRLDALRCEGFGDVVADGVFAIGFWVKVEWASRRHGHGDVLNLVTADAEQSWNWRIGFPTTGAQVMPAAPWPLALRIGEKFSTEELPIDIEPWQWAHAAFVGDGEKVGVYRNGGLIGYVGYPKEGLPEMERSGNLQVNGSNNFDLKAEEGRQGVWECDLRIDDLRLADEAIAPEVNYPDKLQSAPSLLPVRSRLTELSSDVEDEDRFIVESLLGRAEQIDSGADTRAMRAKLLARVSAAIGVMEKGRRPLSMQRGHFRLKYLSKVDRSVQPYEVYVPRSWKGKEPTALVVALHGSTEDETVYFERYTIEEQAEERGWIVVTPYGRGQRAYRDAGGKDVVDVIEQVGRQWKVDESRIYVTGHSMGGMGAIGLPMEYPGLFAASAPVAGWADSEWAEQLQEIPFLWVVGDGDGEWATGTVERLMVEAEKLGSPHEALILEGFDHGGFLGLTWPTVVEVSLPEIFEFFAQHQRD